MSTDRTAEQSDTDGVPPCCRVARYSEIIRVAALARRIARFVRIMNDILPFLDVMIERIVSSCLDVLD